MAAPKDEPNVPVGRPVIAKFNPTMSGWDHVANLFKAGVSAIPVAGGVVASLLTDYIPTTRQHRLEKFIKETSEVMVDLGERIDASKVATDHYAFMLQECLVGAARNPQEEKLSCYKAMLINAALISPYSDEQQEYYLNLVNTLSPVHIRLISILDSVQNIPQNQSRLHGKKIQTIMGAVNKDVIIAAAAQLYQLQFMNTQPDSFAGLINVDLSLIGGRLTPAARDFIKFCTLPSA